jgi:two-component SAPR family response regulator
MLAQQEGKLKGRHVLVVEDELLLAQTLTEGLRKAGAAVLGPVGKLKPAMDLLAHIEPDAVVLNLDLHGMSTVPMADALMKRRIPFIFASGFDPSMLPERLAGAPFLMKPCEESEVIETVAKLLAETAGTGNRRDYPGTLRR